MSSGTPKAAALLFEELWGQLRECHQSALQELEAKVTKLKNDRCLDAQKLEEFYNRNQLLKVQKKSLQDSISQLEERLCSKECERCALVEERMKSSQDHNLQVIAKLTNERNVLEDKNRKLLAELQKIKIMWAESFSEQELEVIPDSPVMPSSLPATSKLKKRKNGDKMKHVRYAEKPLQWSNKLLFNEPEGTTRKPGGEEVLVPETCQLDASQIRDDVDEEVLNEDEVIAETCAFDLLVKHPTKKDTTAGQQKGPKTPIERHSNSSSSCRRSTLNHSPDSTTERSPSLLPSYKRNLEDESAGATKRKKEESDREGVQKSLDTREINKHSPSVLKNKDKTVSDQSLERRSLDTKVECEQSGTSFKKPPVRCASPAFKKPLEKALSAADVSGKKKAPLQSGTASHSHHAEKHHRVEAAWSIDPALSLSVFDSEWTKDEEEEELHQEELADSDCTWVSHSLLQGGKRDGVSGLGHKANDSLDMMFDRTTDGEYKSFICSQQGQSQPCEEDDEEEEKEEELDEQEDSYVRHRKAKQPNFAHIAVVRKKDERRKLKGTTCKECEVYYADLPEEERQKKLSACSRHRFRYIPPNTPENFWEVGFPSTQTCIERGYIREEKKPQERLRRRRPYSALFSPKNSQRDGLDVSL